MSIRNPGEVSFYLGLATATATFTAAAVGLGLLHCTRTRERVAAAGVLLFATLGIAAALATVARGRTGAVSNTLVGVGVVATATYVLIRALHAVFTVRERSSRPWNYPSDCSSSTQNLPVTYRPSWTSTERSERETSRADAPLAGGLADARLLRGQLWGTTAAFAGAVVLAAVVAFPGLFDGFFRSRPVGSARVDPGVIAASATADPRAGPPWAMRVFTNPTGLECVAAGRLLLGGLGTYDDTRTFRKLPATVAGACERLRRVGLLVAVQRRAAPERRTIVYGLSRAQGPVRVTFGNTTRTLRPGPLGSFIDVRAGLLDLRGATAATTIDGRTVRRSLG